MVSLKLSIAMCTYNGERFLRDQLDSLANQTLLPDEVIIGDDGSTDATLVILEEWKKTAPFNVTILRNPENLGYEKNFTNVMQRCMGDVIFPADQDDVWLPEKLKKMAAVFEAEPDVGVVYCGRSLIDQEGKPLSEHVTELYNIYHPLDSSYFLEDFAKVHTDCAGCMSAVRREWVEKLFPFPKPWAHDTWIFTIAPMFTQFRTLRESLMLFRRHGMNASALGKERDWANGRDVYYLTSVGQYRAHQPLRDDLRRQLAKFPDCEYKTAYLKYLDHQDLHFGNRVRIEDHFWTCWPLLLIEFFSGRYFRHKQPIRCLLFDIKEGLFSS